MSDTASVTAAPLSEPAVYRRYSRQMLLEPMGRQGQLRLMNARVLVVGAGGLASTLIPYLAGAGVGFLRIVDGDTVDESNLHRQIMFDAGKQGECKAMAAAQRAQAINPAVRCEAVVARFTYDNAASLMDGVDLVVDCVDNADARYCMSDACCLHGLLLVSASAIGFEGQVTVLCGRRGKDGRTPAPCYRCLHPTRSAVEGCRSCASSGVLGPVPGIMGGMQAAEVIKCIAGGYTQDSAAVCAFAESPCPSAPTLPLRPLLGRQLYFDAATGECESFDTAERQDPQCTVCGVGGGQEELTMARCQQLFEQAAAVGAASCAPSKEPSCGRVSARDYHEAVWGAAAGASVLLDVRSRNQFRLLSLLRYCAAAGDGRGEASGLGLGEADGDPYCSVGGDARGDGSRLRVTVSTMICGDAGRGRQNEYRVYRICHPEPERRSVVLYLNVPLADMQGGSPRAAAVLRALDELRGREGATGAAAAPVYVLCRRGIDSLTAAQLLAGRYGAEAVLNVDGGLQAWRKEVDVRMPEY